MQLYQVDSFTREPFKGNPAGVCIADKPLSVKLMQDVAAEMNLSETAFLSKADGYKSLRWFTPTTEVTLCGHATLASGHVLYSHNLLDRKKEHRFSTASGELIVSAAEEGWIEMDFPLIITSDCDIPLWVGEHFEQVLAFSCTEKNDILELPDVQSVTDFRPDFALISRHTRQGLIITAKSDGDTDFVSRYFVPNVGVPEDPVTGSAHCELAHFWQQRLKKNNFKAYQASKRGGFLHLSLEGDRVKIKGQAVTIFKTGLTV